MRDSRDIKAQQEGLSVSSTDERQSATRRRRSLFFCWWKQESAGLKVKRAFVWRWVMFKRRTCCLACRSLSVPPCFSVCQSVWPHTDVTSKHFKRATTPTKACTHRNTNTHSMHTRAQMVSKQKQNSSAVAWEMGLMLIYSGEKKSSRSQSEVTF